MEKYLEEEEKKGADKKHGTSGISGVSNLSFLSPTTKYSPNSAVKDTLSPIICHVFPFRIG
jgi:hypothetical protein